MTRNIAKFFVFLLFIPCILLSDIKHPVSTTNPEAQKKFDQGLTYIFAFNHDLAFKNFENASQLDPNLAMAYWGMALALGQNINQDVTLENEKKAYGYSQTALNLISKASPVEQAYIKALAQRYTDNPNADLIPLRFAYSSAMQKVFNDYPQDLDASCLYVESILDLKPWKYWTWDGKPEERTLEIISILESVLNRDPNHLGANHYYIHAWEESPTPERALLSAYRLTELFSESGHLLHMPCHIFILCGFYDDAIRVNKKAIAADREYINQNGMGGEYPLHYLSHNLNILTRLYMLSEQYENAMQASNELQNFIAPYFIQMPHLSKHMVVPMQINLYFHRWKELLALPPPPQQFDLVQTFWHYSRAIASINLGDSDSFQKEKALMQESKAKINPEEEIASNPALKVFEIADLLLDANYAHFQGKQKEYVEKLIKVVDLQDRLEYDEPPAWYEPIRLRLGKAYLEEKRYQEAEDVFKIALKKLDRNGRLLFGLGQSLKAQDKNWDYYWVDAETKKALKDASQPMTFENL